MDDASLSEHEQRILDEIERNLVAEDSDFVRRVREAGPRRDSIRLLRLSLFALVAGLALLVGFVWNLSLGIVGFFVMLAGAVGLGVSVRQLASHGRTPSVVLKDAFKRAETRLRDKRPGQP